MSEETESEKESAETSTANAAEEISHETEQVDLSKLDETGETARPSGLEDISETKEADSSEEPGELAIESESIDARELALEKESIETGEQEFGTKVDKSTE